MRTPRTFEWAGLGSAALVAGALWIATTPAAGAAALTVTEPTAATAQQGLSPVVPVCYAFETIEKGSYSGFGDFCQPASAAAAGEAAIAPTGPCYAKVAKPALEAVIRDECTWLDFWAAHSSNVFPPPPAPAVNFDKYAVIAVISGVRSNGCYGMEITHISGNSCGGRTVHVRERVPCPGDFCTLALTNNYHFVKVCKELVPLERTLCFDHVNDDLPCGLTVGCVSSGGKG